MDGHPLKLGIRAPTAKYYRPGVYGLQPQRVLAYMEGGGDLDLNQSMGEQKRRRNFLATALFRRAEPKICRRLQAKTIPWPETAFIG